MKSNKEQSKEEEVITEHCRVISHAPCPPHRGAGGLTTPKGGPPPAPHLGRCPSELLTSFGGVLVGISITRYAGFVLGLC